MEYTHAHIELPRKDFHRLIESIHDKRYKLWMCLKNKHMLDDDQIEFYENEYEEMKRIEDRMKVQFCIDWPGDAV